MKYITKEDSIDVLDISKRAKNCLHRTSVHTIGELLAFPREQFSEIRNAGKIVVEEITQQIDDIVGGAGEWQLVDAVPQPSTETEQPDYSAIAINSNKEIAHDIPIEQLNLSARAIHALLKNGIHHASQLIGISEEEIRSIKNIGFKTAGEILDFSRNLPIEYANGEKRNETSDSSGGEKNDNNTNQSAVLSGLVNAFGQTEASWMREYLSFLEKYPDVIGETLIYLFYEQPSVRKTVKDGIIAMIENNHDEISRHMFYGSMPEATKNTTVIDEILLELESEKLIQIGESVLYRRYPSVLELTEQLTDERGKVIIKDRLNGKTLQEIADKYELTRERIRQLIVKNFRILSKKKKNEDKYKYIYQNYDVSCDDLIVAYGEPASTYYYLDEAYRRDLAKLKPLEEILTDENVSVVMRQQAERAIYKAYITINGVRVKKVRQDLVWFYVKTCCKELTKFDDFVSFYHEQLEELGLGDRHELFLESRNYENRLSTSNQVLWNQGRSFRYYNTLDYDFQELFDTLNLEQYQNVEISTLKLFKDHPALMKEYDIRDEYELHNLLKKVFPSDTLEINFTRMPMIEIGNANREKQVLTLLLNHAPMTAEELALKYEETYGAKALTVMSNYLKCVDIYYHNGLFTLTEATMPDDQLEHMRLVFTEDFYTLTEVQRIYLREFPHGDIMYINPHNLKRLDFRVYSGYVMKNHLPNAAEYFSSILTGNDIVDIRDIGSHMGNFQAFTSELYRLRGERTIIEFSPYRYVNIRRLYDGGMTIHDIVDYCQAVGRFVEKGQYFTVQSLRENGFTHKLDDLGFEDWFYSSLLIEDREHFSYRRVGGVRLLRKGLDTFTFGDMLVDILLNVQKIEIHDLCDLLAQTYGINLAVWKVLESIREVELYYDSIMETVYIDYDTYFEEI